MSKKLDPRAIGPEERKLLENLRGEVFGQEEVLEKIAGAYGFHRSGLGDPNKPIGVFLFVGPPGVGKMATVRALAKYFFKDPSGFCYINCKHQVTFTQRGMDRAHQQMLEKLHVGDMDKLYERSGKLMEIEEELKAMFEKLRSLRAELKNLQRTIKEMEDKKKVAPKNLRKEFAEKNTEYRQLTEKHQKIKVDHFNKSFELSREMAEAAKKGWHYDESNPPQNLLSVVFYDRVEDADEDFSDFLAEIMDNGQAMFIRDEGPMTASFRNSFVFLSLGLSADKFEEVAKGEGHLGFRPEHSGTHTQEVKNFIMEEAGKIFPVGILDRLQIVMFQKLDVDGLMKILTLKIRNLPLMVNVDARVKEYLVKRSLEQKSGAWYLERDFEEKIVLELTRILRSGQVTGKDTVLVKLEGDEGKEEIVFYKE